MATFIIGTIVLGAFTGVGYYTYKEKKKGGSCGGGCSGCPHAGKCH